MDNKTSAEKIKAYYRNHPNKGQPPKFTKVEFTHDEVIDRLMPYLRKGASSYDTSSKNVTRGTIVIALKSAFKKHLIREVLPWIIRQGPKNLGLTIKAVPIKVSHRNLKELSFRRKRKSSIN